MTFLGGCRREVNTVILNRFLYIKFDHNLLLEYKFLPFCLYIVETDPVDDWQLLQKAYRGINE